MLAEGEAGIVKPLEGGEFQLVEANRGAERPALVAELGERFTAPEAEALPQGCSGRAGAVHQQRRAGG
jgi:hypothetical protein